MANSDKNIIITPNRNSSTDQPKISFTGQGNSTVTLRVLDDTNNTLSFEGSAGQLFSISNSLTGNIFSVNDISGIPSLRINSDGTVYIAELSGNVLIGTTTDGNFKLDIAKSGSSGTARFYDQTAATGVTKLVVRAGAGQSGENMTEWQLSGGSVVAAVDASGNLYGTAAYLGAGANGQWTASGLSLVNTGQILFSSTSSAGGTKDLSLSRASAGVLQIGDGLANANGTLSASKLLVGQADDSTGATIQSTGRIKAKSSSDTLAPFIATQTSSTGTYFPTFAGYAENIGVGQNAYITFGKRGSSREAVSLNYYHAGSDSASNALDFYFYGTARLASLTAGGQFSVYNETATTGVTKVVVRAGAGQSTNNLMEWQNSAGTTQARVVSGAIESAVYVAIASDTSFSGYRTVLYPNQVALGSAVPVVFSSNAEATGTKDLGIARSAAGLLEVNNGTAGTFRDLKLRTLKYENAETNTLTYPNLTTSQTAVDTNAIATYRSVKYIVQATYGSEYQTSEIMLIHNGTTADITEYGIVHTGSNPIVTFATDISGGNIRLLATAAAGSTTNLVIVKTLINI